jgi:hypothetical protein
MLHRVRLATSSPSLRRPLLWPQVPCLSRRDLRSYVTRLQSSGAGASRRLHSLNPASAEDRRSSSHECGDSGELEHRRSQRHPSRMTVSSGMAPGPTARDETACNSDDSTADGIEGNHTRQHERQDDGGSATLPVALGAYEQDFCDAEENCDGEERSAGLREAKPRSEPPPIASQQSHERILGQTDEHLGVINALLGRGP